MIENGSYFRAYDYSSKLRDRPAGAVNAQSYWARTVRRASREGIESHARGAGRHIGLTED